jgi:hypothetical protein
MNHNHIPALWGRHFKTLLYGETYSMFCGVYRGYLHALEILFVKNIGPM